MPRMEPRKAAVLLPILWPPFGHRIAEKRQSGAGIVQHKIWGQGRPSSLDCLAKGDQASLRHEGQAHDLPLPEEIQPSTSTTTEARPSAPQVVGGESRNTGLRNEKAPIPSPTTPGIPKSLGFYELFLVRFAELASEGSLRADEVCERLDDVEKSQVKKWLQRGVSDGEIEKLTRPVRYRRREVDEAQGLLALGGID